MRLILAGLLALASFAAHAVELNLVGIMGNRAMVQINGGKFRMLSPGQSIGGVQLISVSGNSAVFDIDGQRKSLNMESRVYSSGDSQAADKKIILHADASGHFFANVSINGIPFRGMIDTGATALSLSGTAARQAGLDMRLGTPGHVSTAAGIRGAAKLSVSEVRFAGVRLYNVDTIVTEGSSPPMPLIGMSILNRFTMQREGDRLILTQRY